MLGPAARGTLISPKVQKSLSFEAGADASPTSKLMLSMIGAFAEFERSMIKRRQQEGIALAKERGVYTGRKRFVSDEALQKVKDMVEQGIPLAKEALQKPSLILRPENFCLLHRLNFCANDCSGYF